MAVRHSFLVTFTTMKLRSFLCLLVIGIALSADAATKKKAVVKKPKPYFKVIEAFNQHILPVKPNVVPTTGDHFIIVWEGKNFPETFFWRGENGWLPCKMLNAHKMCKSPEVPEGLDYAVSHVKGDDIKPGDTLELTPVLHGKFPVPPEIPVDAKNTLYFKVGKSGWLSMPVKEITTKPDVTMPQ